MVSENEEEVVLDPTSGELAIKTVAVAYQHAEMSQFENKVTEDEEVVRQRTQELEDFDKERQAKFDAVEDAEAALDSSKSRLVRARTLVGEQSDNGPEGASEDGASEPLADLQPQY
jgi:hypothetical protein